jgi:Rieske Fe-S protein
MKKRVALSRRSFFKLLAGLGTAFLTLVWWRLSQFQTGMENKLEFRHNAGIPLGVSYFGKYYLFRNATTVRAFSTTCTHAGCRIGKANTGFLQCSCHGSRFDAETGQPVKGPAIKTLQELECYFDEKSGQWIVRLQPIGYKS